MAYEVAISDINNIQSSIPELGQSLSDFGKAVKVLGACEGDSLGKAFSELGTKSESLSIKLQAEAGFPHYNLYFYCYWLLFIGNCSLWLQVEHLSNCFPLTCRLTIY